MTAPGVPATQTMNEDPELARRFRNATLPHLDAVYALARYLLRDPADAEDAVQECHLRNRAALPRLQRVLLSSPGGLGRPGGLNVA
jgi:DNA-directed RNA polymerase specialized sigma24 family protein